MLEIRGLHKIYGKYHALSGLDMTVETGALYGFVGPNGAGKTTTIKIMTGLLEAEEGRITINGMNARFDLGKLKSMIGYVPDFFGVYDNLTVSEYMEFFAACHHINGLVARKRYTALLEQVGLEDKLDFFVDGLSRGMKQRLCLARALILRPKVIVCDEALASLDMSMRSQLINLMLELQEKQGISYIYVTQHLGMMKHISDQVLVMHNGEVVERGSTADVLASPLHDLTRRLIAGHFGEALTADAWRKDGK